MASTSVNQKVFLRSRFSLTLFSSLRPRVSHFGILFAMGCQFSKEEVVFRLRRNPDKNNDKNYARRTLEQVVPPAATSNESGGDTSNMWPGFPNESARQAFIGKTLPTLEEH